MTLSESSYYSSNHWKCSVQTLSTVGVHNPTTKVGGVIESELFFMCEDLEAIEIPKTVKIIERDAFSYCSALKEIYLSYCTQCLTIGHGAFESYSELSQIILPPNLEGMIKEGTLSECWALTHIRVSPNITSIGCRDESNPFDHCDSMLSLELPEGLESIDLATFGDDFEDWGVIARWQSLVNLYLPSSSTVSERLLNEPIPEDWQLAKAAQS
ncbi:unnamed protein product [Cylindrotheca closterium]|uniref:Leucine-rich repeat domain-containing protein n=1 Tax=Cylindrotheca closterium TaxID=2856 RepID=A0AAD2G6R4_9STRA|nr:unnamed protein product [Cylindrotheca closterium]